MTEAVTEVKPATRTCVRCSKPYEPTNALQKACTACRKAGRKRGKGKPVRTPPHRPKPVPVLPRNAGGMDAAAWLKLGGFRVEAVNAPSGTWFRMVS